MVRLLAALLLMACGQDPLGAIGLDDTTDIVIGNGPGLVIRDTTVHSQGDSAWPEPMRLAVGLGSPNYLSHRALVGVSDAPANATGWRLLIWQESALASGIVDIVPLADVNVWDEIGADWYHGDHAAALPWGGSARGLGAIGTDYDSIPESSRPHITYAPGSDILHVVELPLEWLTRPNGLLLKARYDASPDLFTAYSSESEHMPLTVEIDL